MKRTVAIMFWAPGLLLAQWSGNGAVNGVVFRYETKLEPGQPPIARVRNGLMVDQAKVAKRYLCDYGTSRCYGYDLSFEPAGGDAYKMKLLPLSLTAQEEAPLFKQQSNWTNVPFERAPAVQLVRLGDTVAMDLFVHPSTGQKVVEYLTLLHDHRARAETRPGGPLVLVGADGRSFPAVEQGKVCVVLFLMTNCGHCHPVAEMLSRLQLEFGTRNVQVAGAAINQGAPVAQYMRDHNLSFPVGTTTPPEWRQFLNQTPEQRMLVPALALVDRMGRLTQWPAEKLPAEAELRKVITDLIKVR